MPAPRSRPPLPESWPRSVRLAVIHVLSLTQFGKRQRIAITYLSPNCDNTDDLRDAAVRATLPARLNLLGLFEPSCIESKHSVSLRRHGTVCGK